MKETRYAFRYISKLDGTEKTCFPRSEEKKNENLAYCRENGIKVLSVKKLYPFSTVRNQHNFDLIHSLCYNALSDMMSGHTEFDEAEYNRLTEMDKKAQEFFGLELPVAWLPWETYCEAKELANMAIMHRQEACIRNGRADLVAYC